MRQGGDGGGHGHPGLSGGKCDGLCGKQDGNRRIEGLTGHDPLVVTSLPLLNLPPRRRLNYLPPLNLPSAAHY